MKKKILIYRNHLLRPSETFIKTQAEALEEFDFFYAGFQSVTKSDNLQKNMLTVRNSSPPYVGRELIYRLSSRHSLFFREIAKKSPSLIHAHFGPDGVKAVPLAESLRVPLIVTFHGYDVTLKDSFAWHSSYSYFMYLLKREKLKRVSSKFVAVSKFIKDELIQKGFPSDRIRVHYIGVDTQKFLAPQLQKREPIVLFVGRLVKVKGCDFLIKAMARVQLAFPKSKLVVIGDGPRRKELEKLASQTLTNYRFLGFQSSSVVRDWMAQSKVFCVPSISEKTGYTEAFGIVFLEAQSMGLPVVSSLSGGIPEAVEHGKTGFLVPEKDDKGLASCILMLLKDEKMRNSMSENAIERVRSHFDLRKQTKKLENIYLEVLQEKL